MNVESIHPDVILDFYDSEAKLGFILPSETEYNYSKIQPKYALLKPIEVVIHDIFISFLEDQPKSEGEILYKIIDGIGKYMYDPLGSRVVLNVMNFEELSRSNPFISLIKWVVCNRFPNLLQLLPSTSITNNEDDWVKPNKFIFIHKRCPLMYKSVLTGKITMVGMIKVYEPNELFSDFVFSFYQDGEVKPEEFPFLPRVGIKNEYHCNGIGYPSLLTASNELTKFFKRNIKQELYKSIDKTKWSTVNDRLVFDKETLDRGICIFIEDLTKQVYGPGTNYNELSDNFSKFRVRYQGQKESPEVMLVALEMHDAFIMHCLDTIIILPPSVQTINARAVCLKDVHSDKVAHAIGVPKNYDQPTILNVVGGHTLVSNCIYEY